MKERIGAAPGEEVVLTPAGPAAAEIRSGGYLPLRVRVAGVPYRRAEFPGTAVVVGDLTYEVIDERATPQGAVYPLRAWPEGEVVRDRVVYGPRFVRAVLAERERARVRARARPFRFLLYPFVGLLPEAEQERWADRLGLYSVTATLVSGFCEAAVFLLAVWGIGRGADPGLRAVLVLASPFLSLLAMLGLGRAFGAAAFRETSGQVLVELAFGTFRSLRAAVLPADHTVVPLTREAFWARLLTPDHITETDEGVFLRGLLPHLGWDVTWHVKAGDDYWRVEACPASLDRGRLVYDYRLVPVAEEPAEPSRSGLGTAYAREVWSGIEREWDDLLGGFAWLASLLPEDVQRRAFDSRGGPAKARRPTLVTAGAGVVFALYVLAQPHVAADPVGPWLRVLAIGLLVDAIRRVLRARQGAYAPSLFSFLLPSDCLRPERVAYQAHRDAERETLARLKEPSAGSA